MIVVKLIGGLGNQMFQYAFGRSLSLFHKTALYFDVRDLQEKNPKHAYRSLSIDKFSAKINVHPPPFKIADNWKKNVSLPVLNLFASAPVLKLITENKLHFDASVGHASSNSYLNGYWQSPLYFKEQEEVIRNDFRFVNTISPEGQLILPEIKSVNAVSVHIRRGDYVSNPETKSYHGVCSLDYYMQAAETMRKKISNPVFFIFSDDPKWVEENFNLNAPSFIVSRPGLSQFDDLELMASCKHAIIANSSFSWWGAWLINNPDKTVIAPSRWIEDSKVNTNDLFPKSWIRI